MMEVDQPITENGLPKMSPNNVDSVKSSEIGSTGTAQQNGTSHKEDLVVAASEAKIVANDDSSNEAKGLEDEDTMERLMYTDMDEDEDLQPESSEKPAEEEVQNISDTLIEDIIQLNKDSKRTESEPETDLNRLAQGEESSDISPSSSGQSSNQPSAQEVDGEDTNGCNTALMEDESSIGVEEDLTADGGSETKGVADIDEDSESILLAEDNHDLEDDLDVDESLLLDEDVEMEEGASTQSSAIQIEDSVVASENVDATTVEVTDSSVTIDESGLSILNTAAVDIGDMTVDESAEVSIEPKTSFSVGSVGESAVASEGSAKMSVEANEAKEQEEVMAPPSPVDKQDVLAPPSPDISDLIKFPDESLKQATTERTEEKDVIPEVSDLIKFPDEESQEPARSPTPELSDLIKFDSIATVVETEQKEEAGDKEVPATIDPSSAEPKQVEEVPITETVEATAAEPKQVEKVPETTESVEATTAEAEQAEEAPVIAEPNESTSAEAKQADASDATEKSETVSAEVKQVEETPVTAETTEFASEEEKQDEDAPEETNELVEVEIPEATHTDSDEHVESPKDEGKKDSDQEETEVIAEKAEDGDKKEDEKEDDKEPESEEDEVKQKKDACPQALQAADEEDLLEMMEEPERMDADDDQPEEDLDDNSSESGSTKQVEEDGDDEEDFEGSDFGADEDESSRNVDDQDETGGEDIQVEEQELDEGEPPMKRKCSVDLRDAQDDQDVEAKKTDVVEKEVEEKVDEEKDDKAVEKSNEVEAPKPEAAEERKAEEEDKAESVVEEKEPTKKEEKKSDDAISPPEVSEKDDKAESSEAKKEGEVTSEKKDEKMDISEEEPVVSKTVTEESVEEVVKPNEAEKKLDTEDKELKKDEALVSEKLEPASEEKDEIKKIEEVEKEAKSDEEQKGLTLSEAKDSVQVVEKEKEKDQKPAEKTNDEVLVIDDDDDEVAETKNEGEKTEKKAEKRPCPEDDSEEKAGSETSKKIRLSVEDKDKKEDAKSDEQKDEPKPEVQAAKKEEEKKSALDLIEPLKVTLQPEPVPPKEKKAIKLDFLEKFKKPLERMNRTNLEDFVLQKIVEGIAFKSAIAEMRTQLDAQDTLLQGYRQKVHDLNKQFRDLEMVHERVVKDLEKKNQHFITPVKITRAVGLQVSQPRFMAGNRPASNSTTPAVNSPKSTVNRSPVATPPGGSPNKNTPQNNVQNRRPRINSIPSATAAQKSPAQQPGVARPGAPTILNKTVGSPQSSLLNKSATLQGQVTPINNTQNNMQQAQTTMTATQTAPANAGATPPLTRKKPLQKFTPMRPPLSITQQVQQQQQTRQMQEQLMRQQIQEVQTSNTGGQSPLAQSPQGSPLTRTPEPASSPVGTPINRPPQMVMKKVITPQVKTTPTSMQGLSRQTPSMVTSIPSSNLRTMPATTPTPAPTAVDNSLIDLTDEDDVPKPAAVVAPPQPATTVVPKPPITILNGQQQQHHQQQPQYTQRQPGMPPLVVINQQRMMARPTLQQRPAGMVNGGPPRPVLMQRPANVTNGFPRQQTYRARMINGPIGVPRGMIARAPIRQPVAVTFTHPAPLPQPGTQTLNPSWKQPPPRPAIRINNIETGIVISWTMDDLSEAHATIVSYQIYAYQETNAPPAMDMWRHVGDVKAMLLPMAVTLTQFQEGQRYHFAVRAVDEHQRVGQFSPPRTWNESTPAKA